MGETWEISVKTWENTSKRVHVLGEQQDERLKGIIQEKGR
jgi:hypothetical protein